MSVSQLPHLAVEFELLRAHWGPACVSDPVDELVFVVPLQQIAVLFLSVSPSLSVPLCLPPLLPDLALACADESRVDTLISGGCTRVRALEKPWELHLLCKCKPLIDCRARSLSFSG